MRIFSPSRALRTTIEWPPRTWRSDVDDHVDRAHAAELEALAHELGRGQALHVRQHARRVGGAGGRVVDADRAEVLRGGVRQLREVHGRHLHGTAEDRGELARDADDREAVAAVPGDLHVEDRLGLPVRVELRERRAGLRGGVQLQDAGMVRGELELARRAEHAEALDAAELALLQRLAALGDLGADVGERSDEPRAAVGGAADDLEVLLAVEDGTDVEMVGIGVRLAGLDERGADAGEVDADLLDALDRDAGERDAVGEFLDGEVGDVDVFGEPADGKLHGVCFPLNGRVF